MVSLSPMSDHQLIVRQFATTDQDTSDVIAMMEPQRRRCSCCLVTGFGSAQASSFRAGLAHQICSGLGQVSAGPVGGVDYRE